MVVEEGEGAGSRRLFLPGSRWADGKVPRGRGHPRFACGEKRAGLGQSEPDPWAGGVGGEAAT